MILEKEDYMPADYRILEQHNLVHITFSGVMTRGDVLRMRSSLVTDKAYRAGLVEFVDTRSADEFEITYNGMMNIIRHYQELFGAYGFPACMIIVAPGDLGFGMARMFEIMASEDMRFRPLLTQNDEELRLELDRAGISAAGRAELGL